MHFSFMGQASGMGSPCIVSSLLDTDREISQDELEDIKGLGVNLFGGRIAPIFPFYPMLILRYRQKPARKR